MADLGTLLVSKGAIDQGQLDSARSHQRSFGGRIEEILVEQRMVSEPRLADAIAEVTSTRRMVLSELEPEGAARAKLPLATAEKEIAFPLALRDEGRTLWIAVTDPTDIPMLDRLATRAGCRVRPVVAGGREIKRAIAQYYKGEAETGMELPSAVEEENTSTFKITDMSGNTVMTSMDDLKKQHEAVHGEVGSSSPPEDDDDLASDLFDIKALSPEEKARAEKVLAHSEKSSAVLKAIMELLVEKGVLARDELRGRLD